MSLGTAISIERKVNAGFALALACLLLVSVGAYVSALQLTESNRSVKHTHEVLRQLALLLSDITRSESAVRGYVITDDPDYLEQYRRTLRAANATQTELVALTADNSVQHERLRALGALVAQRAAQFAGVLQAKQTEGLGAAQAEIRKGLGKRMQDAIRGLMDQMQATEQSLLAAREQRAHRSTVIVESITWGSGGLAFAFVGAAVVAIRRDLVGRERAERGLRQAKDELELRVRQRTAELQDANRSLEESERRFRAFVTATSDSVYRASPDWTQVQVFQNLEANPADPDFGLDSIDRHVHSDDQELLRAAIEEAVRAKQAFQLEHRVVLEDSSVAWMLSRAVPVIAEQGEITEWFGAATDVTRRKEAEEKLQAQLARLALLSEITRSIAERQDVKSIFQVVIRTLEEHLPVDFCSVCLYAPVSNELIVTSVGRHSEGLAMELALSEQAHVQIDQNGLSRCVQGQLVHEPDLEGASFPFPQRLLRGGLKSLVAAPLLVESQVFGALIAARRERNSFSSGECEFLRQVSEHVALGAHQAQLHDALQRAYEDLRRTQQAVMQQERLLALGQMASGVAHDINNAISPVALYTESLLEREPNLSSRAREYLEIIQRAVTDVSQTVARMREFYREREPQAMRQININQVVQQVIDLTRARWSDMAQERGIGIEVRPQLDAGLPPILGVESELRDALTNLMFNAVDAMPQGGTLTLRTHLWKVKGEDRLSSEEPARPLVELEVIDTGVGMDEDTRRRCLEPFFTTKGDRGTGLGLAMVYGTLQRHGGDLEIDSAVGRGTTVHLRFPVATPTQDVVGAEPVTMVPRARILLVDDDPLVLKSVRDILETDGHLVASADGGQAGIEAFRAAHTAGTPYQMVITDLGMPHVDGRRVSAVVKETAPNTVVVMLTGWGQRLVTDGEVPVHVDRVLSKPPKLRELRETLAQTLRSDP
jgi:signal transduction histidine kinase/CHASE3 domain sensor protein/ActR/RegA family two-component response regulator